MFSLNVQHNGKMLTLQGNDPRVALSGIRDVLTKDDYDLYSLALRQGMTQMRNHKNEVVFECTKISISTLKLAA